MIRGTTANFRFQLPYDIQEIRSVAISFWQANNTGTIGAPLPIVKTLESCVTINQRELSVTLSPHETMRFSSKFKGKLQMEGFTIEGAKFGCEERLFTVYPNKNQLPDMPGPSAPSEGGLIILDGGIIAG